ncbi:prepilin-type N-terminal cleavage/methylation domain-containing protein [Defluviimonas salinarum]|uniref:Prepilin-type N-terminal cleavage/methylation domain-containing protein n=1 Tax=Defluviimonas salinarum TaxID=2992147 RepID=A0ABT3J786_9RHOB|nr:prepilin-type N-terminal cleavage/methylation domain-containing protein [Defluviimonas salinarum]MCW3783537.1 prepilin-type N-terminal cleavage/methylation domain-containing protein [Defluviimonas salinarum]
MIRRPLSRFGPSAGLSLLELLVALALLALVAGGLASSLRLGILAYERSRATGPTAAGLALRVRLRDWLAQVVPPHQLLPYPAGFEGRADRLSFITLAPTPFMPDAAALRVEVRLNGSDLTLSASGLDDDGIALDTHSGILTANAGQAAFGYYDRTQGLWLSDWTDGSRLPDLVRLEVPPGSDPDWPVLVVRPLLGAAPPG